MDNVMLKIVDTEIRVIKGEIKDIEIQVDKFSRHNRIVLTKERFEQISLLDKWQFLMNRLSLLEDMCNTYLINIK